MINQSILEGRLAVDPTLMTSKSGKICCKFVVACPRSGFGRGVDYINCQSWGAIAENLAKYLHKGSHLIVIGALMSTVYEDYKRDDIRETLINVSYVEYLEQDIKSKMADPFFEEYPEIHKLYKQFVKEKKKEKKANESDSEQ